jgi:hypothetical protein
MKSLILSLGLAGLLLTGCEQGSSTSSGDISADNPILELIADQKANELVDNFGIAKPSAYLQTHKSDYPNGTFDYNGDNVYGIAMNDIIIVSDRYFPNVIKHELLHTAGYDHDQKEINGVQIGKYVDAWY